MKLVYQGLPSERLKLLPDGSTIVAHPEREPFLIDPHGQRKLLTCPYATEHQGKTYIAHDQTIYRMDETGLTPLHFTTDAV